MELLYIYLYLLPFSSSKIVTYKQGDIHDILKTDTLAALAQPP